MVSVREPNGVEFLKISDEIVDPLSVQILVNQSGNSSLIYEKRSHLADDITRLKVA